ncbi:MAG: metal ABC transporter permease [Steroidobacteraceae bacterium]
MQEALIGVLFVLASTAQILLLANDPHSGEDLKDLLAGQILWVSSSQLAGGGVHGAVRAGVVALARAGRARQVLRAVRAGGHHLGAAGGRLPLVFSSLIVPALAVYRFPAQRRLWLGLALSVASYGVGLLLSALLDLPAGPMIVWVMALSGSAIHLLAPSRIADPVHGV